MTEHAGRRKKKVVFEFVLMSMLLFLASNCKWPWQTFERNPKLRLVRSERTQSGTRYSLLRPIWSADGKHVYFLRREGRGSSLWVMGGTLWRLDVESDSASEILGDTFCALSAAFDGRRLAMATGGTWTDPGGKLVVLDLSSGSLDTVPTTYSDVIDVVFSRTGPDRIYYCSRAHGVYRINSDGTEEVCLLPDACDYFDLDPSDSVIFRTQPFHPKPAVNLSGTFVASVFNRGVPDIYVAPDDIIVVDRPSGDTAYLEANPYEWSWMTFPCWSPDGNSLLFAAQEVTGGDPLRMMESEIWLIEPSTAKDGR